MKPSVTAIQSKSILMYLDKSFLDIEGREIRLFFQKWLSNKIVTSVELDYSSSRYHSTHVPTHGETTDKIRPK